MSNYYPTLREAVDACQIALDEAQAVPLFGLVTTSLEQHWTQQIYDKGPVHYGQSNTYNFELVTHKGKPTRKFFHITITRMDSGNYELVTYFL